jgi:hypothetical protein
MNLGEGLAFYFVCIGFVLACAIYVAGCTTMGSVLVGWPAHKFHAWAMRRPAARGKTFARLHTDFSPMWDESLIGGALVCFLIFGLYAASTGWKALAFLGIALFQGGLVALFLILRRRGQHIQSGVILEGVPHVDPVTAHQDVTAGHRVFLCLLILAPMMLAPNKKTFVEAAFRLAQLRKDNAVVEVKKEWGARMARSTLKQRASYLGSDYVEFDGVNVLLRSVGDKVVVELPQSGKDPVNLSIPKEAIFIE